MRLSDLLLRLNAAHQETRKSDEQLEARIQSFELAARMQLEAPEAFDVSKEPKKILDLYGPEVKNSGSFTHSALLARRLVQRGVRVVQIMHRGWDQHGSLPEQLTNQTKDTDRGTFALAGRGGCRRPQSAASANSTSGSK